MKQYGKTFIVNKLTLTYKLTNSAILIFLTLFNLGYSAGYTIYTYGQKEHAMLNAVTAHAESPASLLQNPATLVELNGKNLVIGSTIIDTSKTFKSSVTGSELKTNGGTFVLPSFFYTHPFSYGTWALGLYPNFGLGTDWNENWEGRYQGIKSEMKSIAFHAGFAKKITNNLNLGLGLFLSQTKVATSRAIFNLPTMTDIKQEFNGDDDWFGFNLGLQYAFSKNWKMGISYMSGKEAKLEGDTSFTFQPGQNMLSAFLPNSATSAELVLPSRLFTGIAFQPSDKWVVEAGWRREFWNNYNELTITFTNPALPITKAPRSWEDANAYMLGLRYNINQQHQILTGCFFEESPVPDSTIETSQTFGDKKSLGFGYQYNPSKWSIGGSLILTNEETRHKNNTIAPSTPAYNPTVNPNDYSANGSYKANTIIYSLNYKVNF